MQGALETLFDRQYILTEDVVVEVRYRTESRTDSEGNSYDGGGALQLLHLLCDAGNQQPVPSAPGTDGRGADVPGTPSICPPWGNRPDLFPESAYVGKYVTNPPAGYDVPGEYLDDETFAAMLTEAEKYLGYPYVWGGSSSPATSFDCSGFVSWVINHSGWNVGRLGAQGLYNICTPTSSPKPGDLVFFVGTYDTAGVSHCGIYVGDGMMIHCGDPIQYANSEYKLLAIPFLRLRAFTLTRRLCMAVSKSQKIQAEIDKVKAKISEQQARLKELEKNKQEAENSEIVDIVRGMSISLEELPLVLQRLRDGGTSGQSVQKSGDGGKEENRRMKRFRVMAAALCAAVLLCGFSVPAYAYADGGEGADYGDPTMTEETPAPEPEPTIEPGEGFSEEGNLVTRDLLYDEHTNKQFITVQTGGREHLLHRH